MYRTRKQTKKYNPGRTRKTLKEGERPCPFCTLLKEQIVQNGKTAVVVKNIFPYQFWDYMKVTSHLMVIPKRHVQSIRALDQAERNELIDLLADYQDRGYNMYGREHGNIIKSVPHQHTHLIKCGSKKAWLYFFFRKPYVLIRK